MLFSLIVKETNIFAFKVRPDSSLSLVPHSQHGGPQMCLWLTDSPELPSKKRLNKAQSFTLPSMAALSF